MVNTLVSLWHWVTYQPASAAAFVFGGAALAVVLYTYVHDYNLLADYEEMDGGALTPRSFK